ncbi:fibronectin type III domain-containing protein [Ruminococcus albus]|uniref:Fibronectin type-III domain-containing protein n=1 Tax=Ruminococcus albus TaxID=1264 RepID=A0A1I1LU37_RUMAL|nr:fibronectin type III domain-containing protein [Ruminococcus albus]SFC76644.1 hypothetical protein SAMN02910406_02345 [Ruminococcus albus]
MKCRIKTIISTASVLALTAAAAPAANIYAASIEEAPAVISENIGEAVAVTRLATASETTTWNKATTLTEDTVVDGNLNITADVDLNGFSLTINGDLTHAAGAINCNYGKLNINGNYYIENASVVDGKKSYDTCFASLILSEEGDEVNINGDLETHSIWGGYGFLFNIGTVNVSGNINAENGFVMNTKDNSVLVLNGKSNQYVNFGNCPILNVVKVTDPDKREIVWSGDMNVNRLGSDIQIKPDNLNLKTIDLAGLNMVVNGDCVKTQGDNIDINGGSLTFNGDFTHSAGTILCNYGKMNVNGTYFIENSSVVDGKKSYDTCFASLILSEEGDEVNINGDFETHSIWGGYGLLLNIGTVNVSGNINAENGFVMNTKDNSVLVLNGKSNQYVNFGNCPILNVIKVINPNKREIIWSGDMNVNRLGSDIRIKPDNLNLKTIDLAGLNMVVNGDCVKTQGDTININGGSLTFNGDFTHSAGTILCNYGKINVNGTYFIENSSVVDGKKSYDTCFSSLILSEEGDEININGDLEMHSIWGGYGLLLNIGTVNVRGNINADSGFVMNTKDNSVLVLNGKTNQYVYFGNSPILNEIKVINPEKREIIWSGNMSIHKLGSNIKVKADDLKLRKIDLFGFNMLINGNCGFTNGDTIDINCGSLTINGDLTHSAGTILCNYGKLNVNGTYFIENSSVVDGKKSYDTCFSNLILSAEGDEVDINGDLEMHSIWGGYGLLLNIGTVNVRGNINADSGVVMNTKDNSVLVLNGKTNQYVYFGNSPILNEIKVINPEKREIIWSGNMSIHKLGSNIKVKADDLKLRNIDLFGLNMIINGNCDFTNGDTIDINCGSLTINGDLTHSAGTIYCNNGKLNVNGTYFIENASVIDGKKSYDTCFSNLILSSENDKLYIDGDLEMHSIWGGYGLLHNMGKITLSGNINSDSGFNMSSKDRTVLVLNGKTKQTINLAKGTKINILVINKPLSYYVFNQENCWNELVTNYPPVVIKKWEKGYGAVKLTWDPVLGAEKYAVVGLVNGKWQVINYSYKTSSVIKGLKPGVNYTVAVVAKIDGKWNLDASKAITVTPKSVNKYPVVTSEVSGKQFRLNWKPADAAEKYAIAVYQSGKWVVKVQLNGDVTSYTSPKLKNGTYKIAVCAKVNGKWDVSDINKRAIDVTIK